ncbi:DsbA family protein [Frigidibacter sp.]|uniref:DsbA family protein n=1 Tax=Frigidibacter sp. TaxID=2586418 RepID=UPI002736CA46|nr:DsbA family protein [Frigidibacter sp.]MDP3339994.1 DsbA family protein [Frigidibacter sp.]
MTRPAFAQRRFALALAATLTLGTPALAFDITSMTQPESEAFGEAVRGYLMENPGVLMEVIAELEAQQAEAQSSGDSALVLSNAADIYEDGFSWVGGNPEGSLTVVEFIDYRCGYCRKAHSEVLELVETDGDIRYIVKEFPILGEESVIASQFAVAALQVAGPEAYEKINHGLYTEFRGAMTAERLAAFATDLGLDGAAIAAGMDSPEVAKVLNDNQLLAQRLQIEGTPTFVMGDQLLRGYVPLEGMRAMVADVRG